MRSWRQPRNTSMQERSRLEPLSLRRSSGSRTSKRYDLDFKDPNGDDSMKKPTSERIAHYKTGFPRDLYVSIENPFDQDDWEAYKMFMDAQKKKKKKSADHW
jgi:hypothetical protein